MQGGQGARDALSQGAWSFPNPRGITACLCLLTVPQAIRFGRKRRSCPMRKLYFSRNRVYQTWLEGKAAKQSPIQIQGNWWQTSHSDLENAVGPQVLTVRLARLRDHVQLEQDWTELETDVGHRAFCTQQQIFLTMIDPTISWSAVVPRMGLSVISGQGWCFWLYCTNQA